MNITTEPLPEGTRIIVAGRLDATTGPVFEKETAAVLAEGRGAVFLDGLELEYLSSGGIRSVLGLFRKLQSSGRPLFVCGLKPVVREILRIAGLEAHLIFYPTLEEARTAAK